MPMKKHTTYEKMSDEEKEAMIKKCSDNAINNEYCIRNISKYLDDNNNSEWAWMGIT